MAILDTIALESKGWVFLRKSNLFLQKICLDRGVHFKLMNVFLHMEYNSAPSSYRT